MFGRYSAERNFDAHHSGRVPKSIGPFEYVCAVFELLDKLAVVTLAVVVALAVDAAPQAGFGENLLIDLALFAELHLLLEDIDLTAQIRGNFMP